MNDSQAATGQPSASTEQTLQTNTSTEMSDERMRQASAYARYGNRMYLVSLLVSLLYILFWLVSGFTVYVRDRAAAWSAGFPHPFDYPATVVIYLTIFLLGYELVNLPMAVHRYTITRRYGISIQTPAAWLKDRAKGTLLMFLLGLPVGTAIYILLAWWPDGWWLLAALGFLFLTVILAMLVPVLLMPLFYKLTPLEDEQLVQRLVDLARRAGTRIRGVYSIDFSTRTTAANAMLMGLGRTRRIALSDTLLAHYTPDEIETILAHELAHQVHADIPRSILLETAITLAGLYLANLLLRLGINLFSYQGLVDLAAFPLLMLMLSIFGQLVMPLTNAYTRHIEYQADEYAMASTQKPDAFISAMRRLANQNLAELEPSPLVEWFFYDHPAIGKRIRHGEAFKQRATQAQAESATLGC